MDHSLWHHLFDLGLPVAEKIIRPAIVYIFLVIGLRIAGKRELAQMNPFDLVVLLTLSNAVQNAIIGEDNSVTGGLIGASTLLFINYLTVRFIYEHPKLHKTLEGETRTLIDKGAIHKSNLQKELITIDELETAAHKQGYTDLKDIWEAKIEPGGVITFIPKDKSDNCHDLVMAQLAVLTAEVRTLKTLVSKPEA